MTPTEMTERDALAMSGIAECLLWLGFDRLADAIYAAIEAELGEVPDGTVGRWADVFG